MITYSITPSVSDNDASYLIQNDNLLNSKKRLLHGANLLLSYYMSPECIETGYYLHLVTGLFVI